MWVCIYVYIYLYLSLYIYIYQCTQYIPNFAPGHFPKLRNITLKNNNKPDHYLFFKRYYKIVFFFFKLLYLSKASKKPRKLMYLQYDTKANKPHLFWIYLKENTPKRRLLIECNTSSKLDFIGKFADFPSKYTLERNGVWLKSKD